MTKELWADIPGYEGFYEVSTEGRVRSLHKQGCVLRPKTGRNGYQSVALHQDGQRSFDVHRLVLTAFRGPPANGEVCRHKDGDRANNTLDNLVWGTQAQNMQDKVAHGTDNRGRKHPNNKLSEEQVRAIRAGGRSDTDWAEEFSVTPTAVYSARLGRTWGWMN